LSEHNPHRIYGQLVKNLRCHVGTQVGPHIVTSLDSDKDKAVMEITPVGVLVHRSSKNLDRPVVICFSSIGTMELPPVEATNNPNDKPKTAASKH
jgi:hypothetical protein